MLLLMRSCWLPSMHHPRSTRAKGSGRPTHLGVAALLLADKHEGRAVDAADPAYDGLVVQSGAITMQLHKLISDVQDDVEACRPVGVTSHLQPLGRRQAAVCLLAKLRGHRRFTEGVTQWRWAAGVFFIATHLTCPVL